VPEFVALDVAEPQSDGNWIVPVAAAAGLDRAGFTGAGLAMAAGRLAGTVPAGAGVTTGRAEALGAVPGFLTKIVSALRALAGFLFAAGCVVDAA